MCGIAGVLGTAAERHVDWILAMKSVQRHRGPDSDGIWVSPEIVLGHVRLAILDLSEAGRQPMSSPDGRYTIVYNGEVYNYIELREELGGRFQSNTDTEVVLRAYERWGEQCLEHFVGMFAFAIWDCQKQALFCARDRFGIKPFYWALHEGHLLFSSEIKGLLAVGIPREPNWDTIREYLAFGYYENKEYTFFKGIQKLLPGHFMWVRPGEVPNIQRYYYLPERAKELPNLDTEEGAARVRSIIEEAVRLRLRADVPCGVLLSGGMDSSTLLALVDMRSMTSNRLEAFSCDFPGTIYSERPWVEEMVRYTGRTTHFTTAKPGEMLAALDTAIWYADEPIGGIHTLLYATLFEKARERGVKVLLDGEGMDDVVAGYRNHYAAFLADLLEQGRGEDFLETLQGYHKCWGLSWTKCLSDIKGQLNGGEAPVLSQDCSMPVRPQCLSQDLLKEIRCPHFPRPFKSRLKNLMYQGLIYTKVPRVLRFKDRVSMASSCELRIPFLDHRFVELGFGLPDALLISGGQTKNVLRKAMANMIPERVRLAPKRSVQTPQREWLRTKPWKDLIMEMLHDPQFIQRGIVDVKLATDEYQRYCTYRADNSFFLWQWINLDRWFRIFIESTHVESPGNWPKVSVETVAPS